MPYKSMAQTRAVMTEGSKRVETRRSSASLRTMAPTRRKNIARPHTCSGVADHRPAAAGLAGTLATHAPAAPTAGKATGCVKIICNFSGFV